MANKQTDAAKRKEELFFSPKNTATNLSDSFLKEVASFSDEYKFFLDNGKTERRFVNTSIDLLKKEGFSKFDPKKAYQTGDKFYHNHRGKALIACVMGTLPLEEGIHLTAAHVDSPRLDLKPRPLYEDAGLALFKTHYYGGIKKYQWTAIPLSLHGVVVKRNGEIVDISIGEDEDDPVFVVTDLLPHLADEQVKKPLHEAITGEELNVLVGSYPFKDTDEAEAVKLNVLDILNKKYGITERDLVSAELEAVPAFKARDIGFDRSMIGAYGHDDRVCSYPALRALLDVKQPQHTAMCILADKEETGSNSNTGLATDFYKNLVANLAKPLGLEGHNVLAKSKCLSADVTAAFDPDYPSVLEKNNAAFLNHGICLAKYTGSRGKNGTNDANAEFVGEVINMLDDAGIPWQIAELGKVDQGGGGTVAVYLAANDIEVIDIGVPVLSMHSPYEVVSKLDTYHAYQAFDAFYQK